MELFKKKDQGHRISQGPEWEGDFVRANPRTYAFTISRGTSNRINNEETVI